MYFIPFRKIFQSHSAGFHKKEDRKEGTERKASSPSAPPFLLPLRPVRISPCQLDSALLHLTGGYRPMVEERRGQRGECIFPSVPFFLLPHGSMLFHKIGWVDRLSVLEYLKVQVGAFYTVIYRGLA